MENLIKVGGIFRATLYDKDGNIKWVDEAKNLVTTEGLNHIVDVVLHGATQADPWYVGLKNAGTFAAGDTLASHGGWTENNNYTGDRKEYVEAAASSGSTNNTASKASFAIDTDSQTIAGAFLASAATGTSGTLLSGGDFSSAKSADNGDTLEVEYVFSAADDGA